MRMWLAPHCVRLTRRARAYAVAVLGVFAALFAAAPAHASPTWLSPAVLSPAGCVCGAPAAATDAAGDVTVAFRDSALGLAVTRHPAGGTWSGPVGVGPMADPVMAGNAAGDAVLAYENDFDVNAIVDTPGEPWSAATTSTVSTGGAQTAPSVAIDGRGDALVAWETPASGGFYTIDAAYRPAGGGWHQPIPVDDDAVKNVAPSVAFTPGGEATIVWATENGSDEAVASATTTIGTSWTSPIQVATDTTFLVVQVALDSSGEATAAWSGYDGTDYQLGAAERPSGGSWHSDGNLAPGADEPDPLAFDLAVNAAGKAALVWGVGVNEPGAIAAAVRPAGGAWSAPDPLATTTSPDFVVSPQVVVGTDGTVTADWGVNDQSGSGAVWAVRESPAGTWDTPVAISQPIQNDFGGVTVIDPSGDVDVLANLFSGSGFPVWSIVDDAGGPALDGLAVPARGTVGVPVDFAVAPLDAWSAISATHWNFGDGTTATDESVSHVYSKPGTYTVGTSSSDILGNTTSQSSRIAIAAASATGTGPSPPTKRTAARRLTLRVTQAHRRWREATLTAASRHLPAGTRFGLVVNQAAHVTLTFSQAAHGRRLHGHCRARNARDRHSPDCVRTVGRGKLSVRIVAAGRRTIKFTGRLGARRLRAGRYTVTVRATGSGGSATRRLHFTIAS
jgi:PKD domain-containing protein